MTPELLRANLSSLVINLLYAVVALVVGTLAVRFLDKVVFPEVNFMEEIKKGNLAAAVFAGILLLFIAIILGSVLG